MTMMSQFVDKTLLSIFFWRCFVSFVKFSYWSKFHVDIITGSGVMTIYFYKGLTWNPEIEILPSEFCPISGDWAKLGILNLAWMSLNAAKCQGHNIYRFWVIKGKPTGGVKSPLPRLGLNCCSYLKRWFKRL